MSLWEGLLGVLRAGARKASVSISVTLPSGYTNPKYQKRQSVTYKYFNENSDPLIKGLVEELLVMLDSAREKSGIRYSITDGLRSPATNTDPNSVQNSAHLTGKAVDLDCNDGNELFWMLYGILSYFCRIGIYVRFAPGSKTRLIPTHLHVDVDRTKPQKTMWIELET